MPLVVTEDTERIDLEGDGPRGTDLSPGDDDGRGEPAPAPSSSRAALTGIWIGLAAVLMFFMALTSSFVVRKGASDDWLPTRLPFLLWPNTAVLLASSATLEWARRAARSGLQARFGRWWAATTLLGLAFLAGQWAAWRQLAASGVYLATNPSSSFFYLLTATHGVHVLGGVLGLLWVARRRRLRRAPEAAVQVAATYWHFMAGIWVYLFLLLHLGG